MHSQYLSALALALPVVAGYTSTLGCYSKVPSLVSQAAYQFQDYGYCTDKCSEGGYRVAALSGGKNCACSDELPVDSAKVDDDKCNIDCAGWPNDNCGGDGFYTVLSTGDYSSSNSNSNPDSDSDSDSTDTIIMAAATYTTSSPTTAGGGIVVAPTNINESNVPTNILTAPASMVSKASASASAIATANAKVTHAPGITAATSSSTPSSTPNVAPALRAGPIAGAFVAGLGLLL